MRSLFIFIISCLILIIINPVFSFASLNQNSLANFALNEKNQETQNPSQILKIPTTFKEVETIGKKFLANFFLVFKKILLEGLDILKKTLSWLKNIWNSFIFPYLEKFYNQTRTSFKKEIDKRKPKIKKEIDKDKKEIKENIPKILKLIWKKGEEFIK